MSKFRITYECSAAIGIEIEVEANDRDAAEQAGERWLATNQRKLQDAVDELMSVPDETLRGYSAVVNAPFTNMFAAQGDNGFELVDVFDVFQPEDIS